jgi:hypothetical protein
MALTSLLGGLVLALSVAGVAFAAVFDPTPILIQGPDRYQTAVEASKKFASAATVVVATGELFPDALGGAALAGASGGPLLLTRKAGVPAEVLNEITRLGATKIYVLGSTAAVSAAAFNQLDAKIAGTPVRIGGANRYETASLVAAETIGLLGSGYTGGAFLATGMNFPDALAAGPIAAAKGMPIILSNASGGFSVPAAVTKVQILGSTSVVPASAVTALGAKYEGRLFGANRYATAKAVAEYGVNSKGMVWNGVGLATGENFPDALCAGPLLGANNTVLLLTTTASLSSDPSAALAAHKLAIDEYHLFGGLPALSSAVRTQTATVLRRTTTDPPVGGGSHDLPALFCAGSGCHDTDLATIHLVDIGPADPSVPPACVPCHGPGVTPTANCQTCHADAHEGTHAMIVSAPGAPLTCTVGGGCHGSDALEIHPTCETCHNPQTDVTGKTTCQSCHGNFHSEVLPAAHTVSGFCFGSTCHGTDVVQMHAIDFRGSGETPPGCAACHAPGVTPSTDCSACHFDINTRHNDTAAHASWQAGIASTGSAVCATCHGSNISTVGSRSVAGGDVHVPAIPSDPIQEHVGCTCHAYGEVAGATQCSSCHEPHGFSLSVKPWDPEGTWVAAGGHNTPLFDVNGGTSEFGEAGVVIKSDKGTTIEQEWPLPTASVFWSQSNLGSLSPTDSPLVAMDHRGFPTAAAGAAAINTEVGWGSVITCYDCHTELEGLQGPQGANAANFGLDPNFPDDWTKAEITSFDPTGMRKIDTVRDTPNPYYPKLNAAVYMPAEVEHPTDPLNPWVGESIETTQKPVFGAGMGSNPATVTVYPGGFFGITNLPSNGYSMGNSVGRFICQKCHKLTNSFQGLGIEGNGRGARDNALNYMGMSNEAHMEHHNDMVTGQANCVSCHVAIPHGWKRPRLLVYESDPAPYKVQHVWPDYRSTDQAVLRNMAPTNLYTAGNWGYLSNPTATTGSRYQDLTGTNAFTGEAVSSHLEKLDASTLALKELAVGPAHEFHAYDDENSAAIQPYVGFGVNWGDWQMDAEGVEWHGNTEGYFISADAWDAASNSWVKISEYPIQNQCNACTSASAGTHAPQVGTNTGGEGVRPELPAWE